MKKYWCLIVLLVGIVTISSCKKEENKIDEVWKAKNEAEFEKKGSEGYTKLISGTGNGYIYYKVLTPANAGETRVPKFNDRVTVNYIGWLVDDNKTKFDNSLGFDQEDTEFHVPTTFGVNEVIEGWTAALQHMKRGEKWDIFIPWSLAYGTTGSNRGSVSIPGCSTLHFTVELIDMETIGQ